MHVSHTFELCAHLPMSRSAVYALIVIFGSQPYRQYWQSAPLTYIVKLPNAHPSCSVIFALRRTFLGKEGQNSWDPGRMVFNFLQRCVNSTEYPSKIPGSLGTRRRFIFLHYILFSLARFANKFHICKWKQLGSSAMSCARFSEKYILLLPFLTFVVFTYI